MNITVKMNCGSENEIECLRLAKAVMETGCLNFEQEYAKEIMPSIKKYDFSFETNIFTKIKNDKELYYAWQANIAMAFQDAYHWHKVKSGIEPVEGDIHTISNTAAKHFLDLLCRDTSENKPSDNSIKNEVIDCMEKPNA
jgi:hypothetical protein